MKSCRIPLVVGVLVAPVLSEAILQDRFMSEHLDDNSDIPRALTAEYYDNILKDKPFYDMTYKEWFNGPYATGDFFGARSHLEEYGFVPVVSYTGNLAGNPTGGMRQGVTNTSSVNLGFGVNLDTLTGLDSLSGWSIANTWVWRFGESLTKSYIGNAFNVQQNYGSQTMRLYSFFLQYDGKILDDLNLRLKIGRFGAGDNFLSKPIYWMYMNNAMDGNPVGIFKQMRWSAYPSGTWAACAKIFSDDGVYFKAGVYQINSDEMDSMHNHGMDMSFSNALGVNANFEVGWDFNHDDSGKSPGNISAGFAADWYSAAHMDDPLATSPFNCTMYFQADYLIYNMGFHPDSDRPDYIQRAPDQKYRDLRGVVLWGVVQYDPYENLAEMPVFINGGVLLNGLIPYRKDDVICFGAAYGKFSDKLGDPVSRGSYEVILEANYKVQINRFMYVQPDFQYVINPGGGKYSDAFVIGMQFGINL